MREYKLNIEIDVLKVERDEFKFKYHRQFKETLYRDYRLAREEAFVIYYRNKYEKEIIAADLLRSQNLILLKDIGELTQENELMKKSEGARDGYIKILED